MLPGEHVLFPGFKVLNRDDSLLLFLEIRNGGCLDLDFSFQVSDFLGQLFLLLVKILNSCSRMLDLVLEGVDGVHEYLNLVVSLFDHILEFCS